MVLHLFAREEAPQQGHDLVEIGTAVRAKDTERLPLGRAPDAGHDHQQQPATAQLVDLGELLREKHRVSPDWHHVRPELEALGTGRGEGEPDRGVDRRRERYVGEPDRVETPFLQPVDERHVRLR